MLQERLNDLRKVGHVIRAGSKEYECLYRQFMPPYDVNKFPNKWRKMWPACASTNTDGASGQG